MPDGAPASFLAAHASSLGRRSGVISGKGLGLESFPLEADGEEQKGGEQHAQDSSRHRSAPSR
jgi:hypothetical protein